MVKSFGYEESDIGTPAGLVSMYASHELFHQHLLTYPIIASTFFLVQMVATPLWCIVSNRVGRKLCLIFGLFGTSVAMILFGLSQSLGWAIASRALCGLLNGNLAVSRTMVGELAEATGTDKALAFSIFGFCIGVGWMSTFYL